MDAAHITVRAEMDEKQLHEFLQVIRDFDMKHGAAIHFGLSIVCPSMTKEEAESLLKSVKPPMPYMKIFTIEGTVESEEKPS